ncbi:hypothetical protein T265_12578, partial [Opisthorchis viverrini]
MSPKKGETGRGLSKSFQQPFEIRLSSSLNIRLTETRGLRLPDELQKERNRSWAVDGFPAT